MTAHAVPILEFLGAARTVTGSKSLLDLPDAQVLVDCGLFQGRKELRLANWDPFPVDPASLDAIVLTHAHVDHCGYLPRLVRLGFTGPAYCTAGTGKLAEIVLSDSAHLLEEEAAFANRMGYSKHRPAQPLYTAADSHDALGHLVTVDFDSPIEVAPGLTATWRRAGHIAGAAWIEARLDSSVAPRATTVSFSGDLGRPTHPLLRPPAPIARADVVVVESTYGDTEHAERDPDAVIAAAVNDAARCGGVIVVPAFAVDRTEVVLWHLDRLVATGDVPSVPVIVDSPMACRALDFYRDEVRRGSPEIRTELHGTELFSNLDIVQTKSAEESKALNARRGPMVIVSASGMATGGRVVHHLANRIGDHRNTVLLAGFQAPGTRGDLLRSGARTIKLLGQYVPVRAKVLAVDLSSHADRSELLDWLGTAAPRIVYVNHGEPDAADALVAAIETERHVPAVAPRPGERVRLNGSRSAPR
jgi:metallo-beta-lactamase family protein